MTDDTLRTNGGATTFTARLRQSVKQTTIEDAGLYVVLLLAAGLYLTPIESGLVASIKTETAIVEAAPFASSGSSGLTLEKWQAAVEVLLHGIGNSTLCAVPTTVISAFAGSVTACKLTIPDWKQSYKALALTLIIADIFIPYQAVSVSLIQFWSQWTRLIDLLSLVWVLNVPSDYIDTVGLVVTHVACRTPICMLLSRMYCKTMSEKMTEPTCLDGVTLRRVYRRIVFPFSGPMPAMVLIYQFTQIWNDPLFTLVLVSTEPSPAVSVVLILARLGTSFGGQGFVLRIAGAFLAAFPTFAVYILFGDEFAEGVAA